MSRNDASGGRVGIGATAGVRAAGRAGRTGRRSCPPGARLPCAAALLAGRPGVDEPDGRAGRPRPRPGPGSAGAVPPGNTRSPSPRTSGNTMSRYSSTRSSAISAWTTLALPMTTMSCACLRSRTAAARSPGSTAEFCHPSAWSSDRDATSLGMAFSLAENGSSRPGQILANMLPGLAAEQQGPGVQYLAEPERVAGDRPRAEPERPPAVRRSLVPVRVLHDSVQGHELDDDDAAHHDPPQVRFLPGRRTGTATGDSRAANPRSGRRRRFPRTGRARSRPWPG